MPTFTGQLNANEVLSSLFNMIISQQVFADNVKGTYSNLVDASRVEGSMYGDTRLYYASDVYKTSEWEGDDEAANLLALNRPEAPKAQAVTIDVFRKCWITIDNYLSKRAWSNEYAFSDFTSLVLTTLVDTKRIYEATVFNTYIGTTESSAVRSHIEIPIATAVGDATGLEAKRIEGLTIAQYIADLLTDLKDISRDFNDYGFIRSYALSDLKLVLSSKFSNKISKIDMPTVFHDKDPFGEITVEVIPSRYFGTLITALDTEFTGTVTSAQSGKIRTMIERDVSRSGKTVHLFAGDALLTGETYLANQAYVEDEDCIGKLMHNKSVPFMSGFETGTMFWNPRSLTENHYLIWAHNTLEYLKDKPFLTIEAE